MLVTVKLKSKKENEINKFLCKFYNTNLDIPNSLSWENEYQNPIELSDIIGIFVDNIDNFDISMWINLDKDLFLRITEKNANDIIKYLFERYPY